MIDLDAIEVRGDDGTKRQTRDLVAELRTLRAEVGPLREVAEAARGCGNRPCILHTGPYVGMHTNGGCRCRQRIADALARVPT